MTKGQRTVSGLLAVVALLLAAVASQPASAAAHLWDIGEVYSNEGGNIQFIELCTTFFFQDELATHVLTSNFNVFVFPNNLPTPFTNRCFLMATAGFAALLGAPTPDYIIPDGFIDTSGDTLRLRLSAVGDIWDTFSFGPGELPTNGIQSLICTSHMLAECASTAVEVNSPTNFADQTASLNVPCLLADTSGNGAVDVPDLLTLLAAWGTEVVGPPDLSGNGVVDVPDLLALLALWGPC